MRYEDSELLLATPLEKGQAEAEATARHYAVLDLKLAYRNAIRDLSRQGARAGLTSAEIGIVTADEVDRLMSTDDIDQMLASEMTDSDSDEGGPTNGKGSAVNTGWDTADEADADDEQSGSNAGVNEADGYEDEEDGDDEGKLELHETGGGHGREELDKLQGGEDDDELDDLSSGWEGVEEGELGQDEEGNEGGREDGGNEEEEGKGPIDGYVHILQEEAAGFEDEE
ncbi:hypothetical protein K461DRAFT_277277 [Myriangium duriaei CBS 260.36]|uniref:Uncharacterized protein n=1 Tax=Myriangium duriaei CBS 260.36 TaxID=1168546 RepID=A0A9P4J415_9PEZI|nr:hypothetical protein K461DRAFT_277277 [Myriangium duriaei CBS 260.36]